MLTPHVLHARNVEEYISRYMKYYANGKWLGSGLDKLDIKSHETSKKEELINIFAHNSHPITGTLLTNRKYTDNSVSGIDMVFSPTKSIKIQWGLSKRKIRNIIEESHNIAVEKTIHYIEDNGVYTIQRTGDNGEREHIQSDNLVSSAITHYDTRCHDPDLHTHLLVANKTYVDGKWCAINTQILHKIIVPAGEFYTSTLESLLKQRLGINFVNKRNPGKTIPIREILGMSPKLIDIFSKRSKIIKDKYNEFIDRHIRKYKIHPSTKVQRIYLRVANTFTKDKKEYQDFETLHKSWIETGEEALSSTNQRLNDHLESLINNTININNPTEEDITNLINEVLNNVTTKYTTFTKFHIISESYREVRLLEPDPKELITLSDKIANLALKRCLQITHTTHPVPFYSTSQLINEEKNIIRNAIEESSPLININDVDKSKITDTHTANVNKLSPRQKTWIDDISSSKTRVTIGIGVAGAGKTTSLSVLKDRALLANKNVISLAYTAKAAENLGLSLNTEYSTIHKYLKEKSFLPNSLLIIDEASMVNTGLLNSLLNKITPDSKVLLIGDNRQLQTLEGIAPLSYLLNEKKVTHYALEEVHRFKDKNEAEATLKIRSSNPEGIKFYIDNNRIIRDNVSRIFDTIVNDYIEDTKLGKESILLAHSIEEVNILNKTVQSKNKDLKPTKHILRDGNILHNGDTIINRVNYYDKKDSSNNLFNGSIYKVLKVKRHKVYVKDKWGKNRYIDLNYIKNNCELGYSSTIYRSQGLTVDRGRMVSRPDMSNQNFYVGTTRGRELNMVYIGDTHIIRDISTEVEPKGTQEYLEDILKNNTTKYASRELLKEELKQNDYEFNKSKHDISEAKLTNNPAIKDVQDMLISIKWERNRVLRDEYVSKLGELLNASTNRIINEYNRVYVKREHLFNQLNYKMSYDPLVQLKYVLYGEEEIKSNEYDIQENTYNKEYIKENNISEQNKTKENSPNNIIKEDKHDTSNIDNPNSIIQKYIDHIKEYIKTHNIKIQKFKDIPKITTNTVNKYININKDDLNKVNKEKLNYLYTLFENIRLAKHNIKQIILNVNKVIYNRINNMSETITNKTEKVNNNESKLFNKLKESNNSYKKVNEEEHKELNNKLSVLNKTENTLYKELQYKNLTNNKTLKLTQKLLGQIKYNSEDKDSIWRLDKLINNPKFINNVINKFAKVLVEKESINYRLNNQKDPLSPILKGEDKIYSQGKVRGLLTDISDLGDEYQKNITKLNRVNSTLKNINDISLSTITRLTKENKELENKKIPFFKRKEIKERDKLIESNNKTINDIKSSFPEDVSKLKKEAGVDLIIINNKVATADVSSINERQDKLIEKFNKLRYKVDTLNAHKPEFNKKHNLSLTENEYYNLSNNVFSYETFKKTDNPMRDYVRTESLKNDIEQTLGIKIDKTEKINLQENLKEINVIKQSRGYHHSL